MNPLTPFGKLYGRVMDVRNLLYDRDVLKSYELGARTISVGNLTTGGTGKTPLVALIAKMVIDEDETVCILTRGYGRKNPKSRVLVSDGTNILVDAETGGDEPVELAHRLNSKAVIVADPDRVRAARWAREKFPISAFILDDGFQHRRARRDLDIVCIDATNPCGNGRILPAGTLRESFKSLKRANAIVITRTEQVENTNDLEARLKKSNAATRLFKARTELQGFITLDKFHAKTQSTQRELQKKLFAFTGIGNSGNFFASLRTAHEEIIGTELFPDHHRFTQAEISGLESKAKQAGAEALVTTAKDVVKLKRFKFELPCYVAIAEMVIDNIDAFKKLVTSS
ncbi:MAG: tetraacyldisaccharide 4'-kinase [Pyrinomonadaceae bacterium]